MIKKKIITTLALSLLSLGFAVGGVSSWTTETASAEGNPAWLSSFKMVAGAEIRTADPNGIRFTTEISAEQYNAIMEKVGTDYTDVEFGTIICPTYYVENNGGLNLENTEAQHVERTTWDVEYNPTKATEVYQYNGDLIRIKNENLTKEFQAIGYCTVTPAEGEAVTYYATVENEGDNARTPLYVATYNIVNYGNDSDYLLEMVDTAMVNNTLALSQTSASVGYQATVDFPVVATVAGNEVVVSYTVEDPTIATFAGGKLTGNKIGTTNLVATLTGKTETYEVKIPVTVSVDVSRFDGKSSVSSTDLSGKYSFTQTAYYESGVGVWMYGVVTHSQKNWNISFCPIVGGITFGVHSGGENLLPNERKSFENVQIWTINNADGSFTTSFVGLAKESDFNNKVTANLVEVTPIFENGGAIQVHVQAGTTGTSWWQMPSELVDQNGFLTGGATKKSVQFTDTTTKKAFTYSATLNEYGLFFEAEVRTNGNKEANLIFVYAKDYVGGFGEFYLGMNTGGISSWHSVRGLQAGDDSAFGFKTQIYYRAFYSWSTLANLGLVDYNSANPVESTVYLKVLFESGSDTMSYNRTLNDSANVNDNNVSTAYWGCYQGWVGITATKRCDHITKNGIIN